MSNLLKPYPEYKDSGVQWLEAMPAHWDIKPGFAAYREKQEKNTGMVETTVLSLSYGRLVVKPPEKLHGLVPASFETYQIINPGDIVIRPTDLQNDWTSLRVGLARNRGIITSAYLNLQPTGLMSAEYVYYLLHAYDLKKIFYGLGSGLRQNLDFSDLKRLPVLVPPADEQSAIVRYLDDANRRIERYIRAKRKLIALLNEQKQVIIQQAVTRGLDPNVRLKPSGVEWLGDVPEHWATQSIGRFAKVGNGSTPSRSNLVYWSDGSYPWLNSSNVNRGVIDSADQFVTATALRECHLPRVTPGSVLVAITGQGKTRGTAAILRIEATINQHIAYISPKKSGVASEYLQLVLIAAYPELRRISDDSGSTKGALTCEDLKRFKIPLMSLAEQQALVQKVQTESRGIELAVEHAHREIDLIREYRTRLIADVVTGQIDVREAAQRLPVEVIEPEMLSEVEALAEEDEDAVAEELETVVED